MRAICEVVVFLMLAGIALPGLCRVRLPRAWAVAFPRERRAARLILLAFLAANVIYGGGKGDGDPPRSGESPNEKCKIENVELGTGNGERGTGDATLPQILHSTFSILHSGSLPQWFVDYGYPADDSDGDGIPDCWERWTGTDPLAADSGGDLDTDGLSNLVEFWLQADPQCADTDNDGFGDAEEAAAAIAGIPEADPATPAPFAVAEPDANGDGIPDVWEDTGAPLLSGVDADGFPTGFQAAPATAWNYDVLLRVTTSRHALLSWGGADSPSSAIIPPCDGQTLRLRLRQSLSVVPAKAVEHVPVDRFRVRDARPDRKGGTRRGQRPAALLPQARTGIFRIRFRQTTICIRKPFMNCAPMRFLEDTAIRPHTTLTGTSSLQASRLERQTMHRQQTNVT